MDFDLMEWLKHFANGLVMVIAFELGRYVAERKKGKYKDEH